MGAVYQTHDQDSQEARTRLGVGAVTIFVDPERRPLINAEDLAEQEQVEGLLAEIEPIIADWRQRRSGV